MKRGTFALALVLLLTACSKSETSQPSAPPATASDAPTVAPTQVATSTPLPKPTDTPTPLAPTKPATATVTPPIAGDLGWRKLKGVVYAGTQAPSHELAGALVECSQFSYVPREGSCAPYQVTTGPDGAFEFDVFLHDTDRITLSAYKSGYEPTEHQTSGFDCVAACPPVNLVLDAPTANQNVELVGHIGNSSGTAFLQGNYVYANFGP
ncbi:MAG: hypothetical protein PVF45_08050, partial [Anaerolineae bacterium]